MQLCEILSVDRILVDMDGSFVRSKGDALRLLAEMLSPAVGADKITVESRRGKIALMARADEGTPRGAVFIPFAFYEAAANELTNAALDPFGKIAELKYCAVRVKRGGELQELATYGGGQSFVEKAPA